MSDLPPNIRSPTPEQVRETAAKHFIDLSDEEATEFAAIIDEALAGHEGLEELPPPRPGVKYTDRDPGHRPGPEADPLNAFVTRCEVRGADEGPLAGWSVGLKDNISLAGVEMTCGSKLFEGYVPSVDATVATRLLDAGATITGKLNMDDMGIGGTGELSAFGAVANPRDPDYLAGGSSSGPAAAVVAGEVDAAIGGDQGGSIRTPASWTGCVGLKPTSGLVPYTGVMGLGSGLDHVGPMTRTVEDCARVLEAIAGRDPRDHRQGRVPTEAYTDAIDSDPEGLTVGVLHEGFAHEELDSGVERTVEEAVDALEAAGAEVTEVSVPMHPAGGAIWLAILLEEFATSVENDGIARGNDGYYDTAFHEAFGRARRAQAHDYVVTAKLALVLGQYLADEYRGRYYARARNLAGELTDGYDAVLADVDVLAMPATMETAREASDGMSRVEIVEETLGGGPGNAGQFNVTGHPALSVPCGTSDGLPVGLELVGERFDDATVLRAGAAVEGALEWEP